MSKTNKELADLLTSAASALNHGRHSTAQAKVAEVYKALHPQIEGADPIDLHSTIQEISINLLLPDHQPIIPGKDKFGAFVMFGEFRSAMPSSEVAHAIAHLLNRQSYCGYPGCPCGPVDPPHKADFNNDARLKETNGSN